MSDFKIQPAARTAVQPLVAFYGKSGSGKTMSALLFARGLVGAKGRVVLVDTENRRGSLFADLIPGGYSVLDLDEPFTPTRYAEAIAEAEKNADAVVIDSASHEWYGPGGVLEMQEAELQRMAGDDFKRREACKMASWIKPKMAHKAMVSRLLRCRLPLICCLRGEEKTHMQQKPGEKTKVVTDDFSTPIADPRFIFELTLNLETVAKENPKSHQVEGGFIIPRKITHPHIGPLLPGPDEQIGVAHGEAMALWCRGAIASAAPRVSDSDKALKRELWTITRAKHHEDALKLSQFLLDENLISDTESLADLAGARLAEVVANTKQWLAEHP